MKLKSIALCLILITISALCAACSKPLYKDGVYSAQMPSFGDMGWKETLELTIEDGKIAKVNWDAVYKDGSIPIRKKQYSKSGLYGMLKAGAIGEWYDQAIAAEQFVLANGADSFTVDKDGFTDAIAGCTIEVHEFELLLKDCLAQAKK